MSDTLAEICAAKLEHIKARKKAMPESMLMSQTMQHGKPRGFKRALRERVKLRRPALIAEIKKASPSKGLIREDFDPAQLAVDYNTGGATCLSVLTDTPYFQGADEYLIAARNATKLPVLRKDFMLDSYQVTESRALGADCILLIMAALSDAQAAELEIAATEYGMDVLVEVHNQEEFERALAIKPNAANKIFGINNRNLKTLEVMLETSERLSQFLPEGSMGVSESGIASPSDIRRMQRANLHVFLVGESLMKQSNVAIATHNLLAI